MKTAHITYCSVIVILIALLLLQKCNSDYTKNLLTLQQSVLDDSLQVVKDKYGKSIATIANITADYSNLQKLRFADRDSLARQLQKVVTRRTQAAAIATLEVNVDTVLLTDTVYITAGNDSCRPTYRTFLNDLNQQGYITANADSFHIKLRYPERLTWLTEWSKWRLFKKRECTSTLYNQNPYVDITGFRTYTVKCDCSKKSWIAFSLGTVPGMLAGFGAGYGYAKLKP